MGMAVGDPPPRAPYKRDDGLMYCENCRALYSRGGWCRGYDRNRRTTLNADFRVVSTIPDDICPMCRTKEEPDGSTSSD
jgi:hypothetical protein